MNTRYISPCETCSMEKIPVPDLGHGLFFSSSPFALPKLSAILEQRGIEKEFVQRNVLLISLEQEGMRPALEAWIEAMNEAEYKSARGVLLDDDGLESESIPSILFESSDILTVLAQLDAEILADILSDEAATYSYVQPIYDVLTGKAHAIECLFRAEINGEIIPPNRVFAAASANALLHRTDQVARRAAVRDGGKHLHDDLLLFINFIPTSIYDPRVCLSDTVKACKEHNVDFSQLVFEVVETEKIENMHFLREVFGEFRRLGAKIAVDDLGSGYSSLRYLSELHPDYVKIDRELVDGVSENKVKAALLDGITALAHRMDIQVIAEGIETAADLTTCKAFGVDLVQGYFLSKPARQPGTISEDARRILLGSVANEDLA